ncbi:hypothetical protein BLX42_12815 [Pseudomonas sp. SG-MS2]|nr:hypothetical protein BLX42_12815 [Pseudomonas sp. SG-MS2]
MRKRGPVFTLVEGSFADGECGFFGSHRLISLKVKLPGLALSPASRTPTGFTRRLRVVYNLRGGVVRES